MKNYDPTKERMDGQSYKMKYGWAMSRYLLYCDFKWVKNVGKFDVNSISENSSYGYILEVDLEYPDELHNPHNNDPIAPKKLETTYDRLSDYCKKIADKYNKS